MREQVKSRFANDKVDQRNKTTGVKNIYKFRGKYRLQIMIDGHRYSMVSDNISDLLREKEQLLLSLVPGIDNYTQK